MMAKENKFLKWSTYGYIFFALLAVAGIILFVLIPIILSAMLGIPAGTIEQCEGASAMPAPTDSGPQQILAGVCSLLDSTTMLLGALIFLLIIPAGLLYLAALILTFAEIIFAKNETGWKLIWAVPILCGLAGGMISPMVPLLGFPLTLVSIVAALIAVFRSKKTIGKKALLTILSLLMGVMPIYCFVGREEAR